MEWNKYQENLIKKWSEMAKTYSIMHSLSSQYYSKWEKIFGIPAILLGSITASSIFTTASEHMPVWSYINGGLTLFVTGLIGVSNFLGTREKQVKHTTAAFKYTTISMNIDTVLSFPRSTRDENPTKFMNSIKLSILEIREHTPNLPNWIISNYIKKLDKGITNTRTKVNRTEDSSSTPYDVLRKLQDIDKPPSRSSEDKSPDSNSDKLFPPKEYDKLLSHHHHKRDMRNSDKPRRNSLIDIVDSDEEDLLCIGNTLKNNRDSDTDIPSDSDSDFEIEIEIEETK